MSSYRLFDEMPLEHGARFAKPAGMDAGGGHHEAWTLSRHRPCWSKVRN